MNDAAPALPVPATLEELIANTEKSLAMLEELGTLTDVAMDISTNVKGWIAESKDGTVTIEIASLEAVANLLAAMHVTNIQLRGHAVGATRQLLAVMKMILDAGGLKA